MTYPKRDSSFKALISSVEDPKENKDENEGGNENEALFGVTKSPPN